MSIHSNAGLLPDEHSLVNLPRLVARYYSERPDPSDPAQQVAFGTSGHRGSSLKNSFNEWHILAVTQAICEYRRGQGIDGPLYIGMDTHALSEPAFVSALEVLAANRIETRIDAGCSETGGEPGYTPTPAISRRFSITTRAAAVAWPTASSSPRRTTRRPMAASNTTPATVARPIPA